MEESSALTQIILKLIEKRLGDQIRDYSFPPPVFTSMNGEFLHLDLEAGLLSVKFPISKDLLNPYGTMQGGMIVAAVDNTIGPLSVVVAPPSVTRSMEIVFSKPVKFEMKHIIVLARLKGQEGPQLAFDAEVRSPDGAKLARVKARHWIIQT